MDKQSRLPLYVQVKNYIAASIDSGEYPIDAKLPTEQAYMAQLGVGRATVRAALSELEREGRVLKKHGIGTFVTLQPQGFALEPLISLRYSLERMGLPLEDQTLVCERLRPDGELLAYWHPRQEIGHLRRLRLADNSPIALEDNYSLAGIFEFLQSADQQDSLAHALLSQPGINLERVELSIVIREPSEEEQSLLCLRAGEKVACLSRWIFTEGDSIPINFVRFVIEENQIKSLFQLI